MLTRYKIVDGKLVEGEAANGQVQVYVNPDDAEKRRLVDEYKLDEHTLNSALDPDELSRMEFEPEHMALIFKRPKNYCSQDNFLFRVTSTGVFLFKDRLIIVVPDEVSLFEGKPFTRVSSLADIMLKLISRSIFHFIEHLKAINMISTELEERINTAMENKLLFSLFTLEKSLVYYLNAINCNSKAIERLRLNTAKLGLSQDNVEYLDDLTIENNQCYEQAEIYSNILSSMMDARASIVSNNLNVLMKKLNILTISVMVPTLVVSAFSMNVGIPLAGHPLAFWIVLGLAVLSVLGVVFVWWWKKW